jgi:hypothetical protein
LSNARAGVAPTSAATTRVMIARETRMSHFPWRLCLRPDAAYIGEAYAAHRLTTSRKMTIRRRVPSPSGEVSPRRLYAAAMVGSLNSPATYIASEVANGPSRVSGDSRLGGKEAPW